MPRGKKKNKQGAKGDAGESSVAEGESSATVQEQPQDVPSTSQVQDVPSTSEAKPTTVTTKDESGGKKEKETPKEPEPKKEEKEEEDVGLGLGLGGGGKKRPRKKKSLAAQAAAQGAAPAATQAAPVQAAPAQGAPVQAAPVQAAPAAAQPTPAVAPARQPEYRPSEPIPGAVPGPTSPPTDDFPPPGKGRGRGWGASMTASAQQSPPVVFNPPSPAPVQSPPPGFVQRSATGRGRGSSYEPKIAVVGAAPAPTPRPTAVCRYQIPAKVLGGVVPAYKTRVVCNYLEMKIQPLKVYRFDVTITPDRPKKLLPKVFTVAKGIKFPKQVISFDQRKNCYSLNPLWTTSDERCTVHVEILDDNDAKMSFEVSWKKTGVVDLGTIINHMKNHGTSLSTPMEAIQCIDVILQQGTLESYVKAGRQFFKRPRNPIDLSAGLEMWTGLFQSAIFTSRAFINIDVAHKGFPRQQNLVDALVNDFRLNPKMSLDGQRGVELFQQFVKSLRVKANIAGAGTRQREYICNGIVEPPIKMRFQISDANGKPVKEMTVAQYFETEKRCRIRYPELNCMWVGPKDKNIYYPMEMLEIVYGQALNKQLNEKQLSTMVREAATPPSDRLAKIKEVIRDMKYSENPCFKHFKLEIDDKFFQVDAKILEAPKIDIGGGRPVDPRRGAWQANRFLRASSLESWGMVAVDVDPRNCDCGNVIQMVIRLGRQMGMSVNNPAFTKFNVTQHELRSVLMTAQENRLTFMFIIISGRDKDAYHKIKRKAELEVGMLTQCIREMTVSRRMNDQTVRNILLKVNSKLMGVNQALDNRSLPQCLKSGGVMVVGADVTHPSPDQMSVPSIAAVTASIDVKCFVYHIEMSIQTPKNEIIVDFENMMFDQLKIYKSHHNALPKKIFVFRDGVSEGQFAQVMNSELVAVHKAYARHDPSRKVEVLFLLVQKRHHTRFFMGEQNPQNVEPGTVVDTHIVHPKELDFYLVSHQAIKGTARPTRYHAVCNDGNIPSDEVEQLTYYLCHLYSRCTRAVSYPTPTYYAHLACFRAKSLT
ncbi:protein argonaute-2 [Bicyclus anynana]|uniref:Protein argonaute-2 n=1 Tax=Bicyclus anynana TaxID=110368 RepID=A0ABM3LJY0_BICAN|nr:protein argonaute-2 [Bicyclus anynana]XP_052739363.1 protein argonaute-2 [Bicyclus anynana]